MAIARRDALPTPCWRCEEGTGAVGTGSRCGVNRSRVRLTEDDDAAADTYDSDAYAAAYGGDEL